MIPAVRCIPVVFLLITVEIYANKCAFTLFLNAFTLFTIEIYADWILFVLITFYINVSSIVSSVKERQKFDCVPC